MNVPALTIKRGTCFALYAYDIGLSIDLEKCKQHMAGATLGSRLRQNRRAPKYFDYDPAPLNLTFDDVPITVNSYKTAASVDMTLYDFGGVSISYTIPFSGDLQTLREISCLLYESHELLADSRKLVEQLLGSIGSMVRRSKVSDLTEDYAVFQVEEYECSCPVDELHLHYAKELAAILRAETEPLSEQEISDALSCRLSFGKGDITFIDWNAAVLFDRDADDVRAVLDFTNLELLEMRVLDHQLDSALDRSYETMAKSGLLQALLPGTAGASIRSVSQMQVDGAILFERVSNAPKLLGDQYLSRVYRLSAQRFHLAEWNSGILRKLDAIEGIYQQMHNRAASWRLELLEWIIVFLIALELLMPMYPKWFAWMHE
ncbi:MAG: hypothetical protein V2A34_14735 [Lentisphaerota bacterium]